MAATRSGMTIAEAVKLGARGVGHNINAVAHFLVKCALSAYIQYR